MTHPLSDGCPTCSVRTKPARFAVKGDQIHARYRCSACLWSWTCGWSRTAFDQADRAVIDEEAA